MFLFTLEQEMLFSIFGCVDFDISASTEFDTAQEAVKNRSGCQESSHSFRIENSPSIHECVMSYRDCVQSKEKTEPSEAPASCKGVYECS